MVDAIAWLGWDDNVLRFWWHGRCYAILWCWRSMLYMAMLGVGWGGVRPDDIVLCLWWHGRCYTINCDVGGCVYVVGATPCFHCFSEWPLGRDTADVRNLWKESTANQEDGAPDIDGGRSAPVASLCSWEWRQMGARNRRLRLPVAVTWVRTNLTWPSSRSMRWTLAPWLKPPFALQIILRPPCPTTSPVQVAFNLGLRFWTEWWMLRLFRLRTHPDLRPLRTENLGGRLWSSTNAAKALKLAATFISADIPPEEAFHPKRSEEEMTQVVMDNSNIIHDLQSGALTVDDPQEQSWSGSSWTVRTRIGSMRRTGRPTNNLSLHFPECHPFGDQSFNNWAKVTGMRRPNVDLDSNMAWGGYIQAKLSLVQAHDGGARLPVGHAPCKGHPWWPGHSSWGLQTHSWFPGGQSGNVAQHAEHVWWWDPFACEVDPVWELRRAQVGEWQTVEWHLLQWKLVPIPLTKAATSWSSTPRRLGKPARHGEAAWSWCPW